MAPPCQSHEPEHAAAAGAVATTLTAAAPKPTRVSARTKPAISRFMGNSPHRCPHLLRLLQAVICGTVAHRWSLRDNEPRRIREGVAGEERTPKTSRSSLVRL